MSLGDQRDDGRSLKGCCNPLGEDDDDFECNFLIDKNIAVDNPLTSAGMGDEDVTLRAQSEKSTSHCRDNNSLHVR
ncbi:hypothetical protein KIN20_003206 [Parelaphostrongylus tenuis]|uniref:Bestrophin homolog n=1 Tax=Parelaphostrongylus tenuis TaxID=148309 RepID=A0AAD5MPL0_PARTN|nr:hypothetical protein KIN20_003206 [Parelaphostrongylus tenuis]